MGLFSFFQSGAKYFDKKIEPKCDYCMYGKRTKDGNRVLCEKRGLVEQNYSCKAFIYSPLKRIPVKQLRFVGSIADDELFIESKGDIAEKQETEKKNDKKSNNKQDKKTDNKPVAKPETEVKAPEDKKDEETAAQLAASPAPAPAPVPAAAPQPINEQQAPVKPVIEQTVAPAPDMPKPVAPVPPVQNVPVPEKNVQQNDIKNS